MQKKVVSLLLIFSLCLTFSSCYLQERVDITELMRRMKKSEKEVVPELTDAFFSDDEWFVFMSVLNEDDTLLTAKEGEGHLLLQVSLTMMNMEAQGQAERFISLCECMTSAFSGKENTEKLLSGIRLYEKGTVFSEKTCFFEEGRYKLSLFNDEVGSTLLIELVY